MQKIHTYLIHKVGVCLVCESTEKGLFFRGLKRIPRADKVSEKMEVFLSQKGGSHAVN